MAVGIGIILVVISLAILIACTIHDDITPVVIVFTIGFWMGTMLICVGIDQKNSVPEPTPQEICEENSISYGLVQAVAEYTDKTEEEITQFFIIVQDDVEAYEAIQMLDNSLTEKQINAILEIGAMKQAE